MSEASNHQLPPIRRAWVTLLTRTSYLPGAVLLAHSLHKNESRYPLIILTTPSLPSEILPTLSRECFFSNAHILAIESFSPPPENTPKTLIATRFADTWTKLRVFELYKHGLEKMVFLDADMLVMRNMDELFDLKLPRDDWIAANHACVCNLDHDSWAPEDWKKENCAYTGLQLGDEPTPVPARGEGKYTHTLLNSGMFVFVPSEPQWEAMRMFMAQDARVKTYMFPDQDLLADFFEGRWQSTGWEYNALKTMRYWHPSMWKDEEVRNLHYIVDKPWSKRVGEDGVAGYLGRDGETHKWWWKEYGEWEKEREGRAEKEILDMVRREVARPLGDTEGEESLHGNWTASS